MHSYGAIELAANGYSDGLPISSMHASKLVVMTSDGKLTSLQTLIGDAADTHDELSEQIR